MKKEQNPDPAKPTDTQGYTVQILGTLDQRWSEWFEGLELAVSHDPGAVPSTTIVCLSSDQAQLRGILNKLWDLNLKVVSILPISSPEEDDESA